MKTRRASSKMEQVELTPHKERLTALMQENEVLKKELAASGKKAAQYLKFIEKANDIIYETDANGQFTFVNRVTEKIIGFTRKNLIGRHYLELVSSDYRDEAARFYGKQFVYKIRNTYLELPLIARTGEKIWLGQHVQLLMRGNRATGFQAIARDITQQKQIEEDLKKYQEQLEALVEARTIDLKKKNEILNLEISERKQAESALRESEEKYRNILETIEDGYYEVDPTGSLTFFNDAMARINGYSRAEMQGMNYRQYTDPQNAKILFGEFNRIYRTGNPSKGIQYEMITKNGENRNLETSVSLVKNALGKPVGFRGISRDITELKSAEEALQKAHAKMTLLINSISSVLIAVSEDNRIIFWNTEAEKQFGIPEKEVLGKPLRDVNIQWDRDHIIRGILICREENTSVWLDNIKFLQLNGKEGILGIKIDPVFGEKALEMETLIQGANITQRRIMESQLAQAQKMESIGQLAAGIAHEINTPIQYIGDNMYFLKNSFEDLNHVLLKYGSLREAIKEGLPCGRQVDEVGEVIQETKLDYLTQEIPRAIHQTLEGVERVSRIVQSIKAFAHPGKEKKVDLDINQAIETNMMVARNEWKYVADLVTDLDPSLPQVSCVPGDINQVILNLLVNAAQAVSEVVGADSDQKGRISISTRQDNTWVEIRISDTGRGIPLEIQPKIFDPFFTTKEAGKGSGQGLAISYTAVVERHQGAITFDTMIGKGTTFIVRLPIKDPMEAF
jgi:PAS domain S-box-containing protein